MKTEQSIEKYLCRLVKEAGGMCVKLVPNPAGLPDRLVIMPDGRNVYVEMKAEGGYVTPIQTATHVRLRRMNQKVYVLWSYDDVDWFMEKIYHGTV